VEGTVNENLMRASAWTDVHWSRWGCRAPADGRITLCCAN